jgi:hypothetical protein
VPSVEEHYQCERPYSTTVPASGSARGMSAKAVGIMSYEQSAASESSTPMSGWVGWVAFAATILFISGLFSIIQGLVAIIGPNTYFATVEGELFLFDVAGWGWYTLVVGFLVLITGMALMSGQTWARVLAIIVVILSMVGQLLLIPAQPWWSFIVIAIDILVLFAVITHGGDLKATRRR